MKNRNITHNAPIGKESWFGCGGSADLLFRPNDAEELSVFLQNWPLKEPLTIIGGLANTIIRDGGLRGATVQLGKGFSEIVILSKSPLPSGERARVRGENIVQEPLTPTLSPEGRGGYILAGCSALNGSVAASAMKAGIGGLEFLSGIPGTLGGAIRMNAGAYGAEMKDVLIGVNALNRSGQAVRLTVEDLKMSYRRTEMPEDMIFLSAILKGTPESYDTVKARMTEIKEKRNATQPIKEFTGGSTFANPTAEELRRAGLPEGTRAWQLVEMVGGRGLTIGGAQMSEKHCNFMINTGNATARDLETLGDTLIDEIQYRYGVLLHWEIKRVGEKR